MSRRHLRCAVAVVGILAALAVGAGVQHGASMPHANPRVDAAQECTPSERILSPSPSYLIARLGLEDAWALSTGEGVTVAVVDSGVKAGNVHLTDALVPGASTFGNGGTAADDDIVGHGTAIAGLIAARSVDGSGIVGIAPGAKIMPVRAFQADPASGQSSNDLAPPSATSVANGIRWAADHGAQIINVSLSDDQSAATYVDAVAYARGRGALVIASAGNRKTADSNRPEPQHFYPGELEGALAVAAVMKDGSWSADSSYPGAHVDIAAPGQAMPTTFISGGDCVVNGESASSSYATAVVSGAAALVAARFPNETPDEWAFRLTQSAMRVAPAQRSDTVGWGEVRPAAALALVDDGALPGPPSAAHPSPQPSPQATRTVKIEASADPLEPARAIVGWGVGVGATVSVIVLLLARARAKRATL